MGTKTHKPSPPKSEWNGRHGAAPPAPSPGARPGVPSRLDAAKARAKQREE